MSASEASTFRRAAHRVRCALRLEEDDQEGEQEVAASSSFSTSSSTDAVVARLQEQHTETVNNLLAAHASEVKSLRAMVDGLRRAASTQQEQHGGLAPFAVAAANAASNAHPGSVSMSARATAMAATSDPATTTSSAPKVRFLVVAVKRVLNVRASRLFRLSSYCVQLCALHSWQYLLFKYFLHLLFLHIRSNSTCPRPLACHLSLT